MPLQSSSKSSASARSPVQTRSRTKELTEKVTEKTAEKLYCGPCKQKQLTEAVASRFSDQQETEANYPFREPLSQGIAHELVPRTLTAPYTPQKKQTTRILTIPGQ